MARWGRLPYNQRQNRSQLNCLANYCNQRMTAAVSQKPAFLAPAELKACNQWVLWRQEARKGKPTKVPCQCNGKNAKSDDPRTWTSYSNVLAAFRPDRFSGIGFVLSHLDPFAGIDLDNCLGEGGNPKPWTSSILEQFANTYCEISPSNRGVKCFMKAALPGKGKAADYMDGRIEMYDQGRFFTVTGRAFSAAPLNLADCQRATIDLYERLKRLRSGGLDRVGQIHPGGRHKFLISIAGKLRASGMDHADILAQLAALNQECCSPPKPRSEVEDIVEYVCKQQDDGEEPSYNRTSQGLILWKRTREGRSPVRLTNFNAQIVADITRDDGVEQTRMYEITADTNGKAQTFKIPASQFASMNWPSEKLGPTAIVSAGSAVKDHARAAIQRLSENVRRRALYTHTGWRKLENGWVFLHGGGAIGADAVAGADVEVELDANLERFVLPEPPEELHLIQAVRASMQLLGVAPLPITGPLFCAVWRAPLGKNDLAIHVAGASGAGKTSLTALVQQHFGSGMSYREPPASWESSENALEELAFQAKDTVLSVDDFVPKGDRQELRRYHAKADRLFRSQGNRSARQRMRADGSLRPARPPRGFVVSTGEEIPESVSVGARRVDLFVKKTAVNWDRLKTCQADASGSLYSQAMAGYIRWLAPVYEERQRLFFATVEQLRDELTYPGAQSHR